MTKKKNELYNARQEILKYNRPFATLFGKYELVFEPHLLGSMIRVSSKDKDEFCGHWLLADAPLGFIVALGASARQLNLLTGKFKEK